MMLYSFTELIEDKHHEKEFRGGQVGFSRIEVCSV
jgi:hypothetical protein